MSEFTFVMDDGQVIKHHGILGMKWGQRNGPPYPLSSKQMNNAERKSYGKQLGSAYKAVGVGAKKIKNKVETAKQNSARYQAKHMTDEELRKANDRMNLERNYVSLKSDNITKGMNFVENTLIVVGTTVVTDMIKNPNKYVQIGKKIAGKFGLK